VVLWPEANGWSFPHQNGAKPQRQQRRAAVNIMVLSYTLNGLLEDLLREGASEMHLSSERPPQMLIMNEAVAVGSGSITNDNISDLLYNLASVHQMKELNACGDVRFVYLFRNGARFLVIASMTRNVFSITIKDIAR
jgi:Tfp pilus assembly ATPase PilU